MDTVQWSRHNGLHNANSPNATATVDTYGPYVFRWTEVNGYAGCTSGANVTVNFYQSPTSTIVAGSGNVCGLVQTVAATLTTGSAGTWSQVSGPGTVTFGSASALSTSATADLYGTYVIQWEENNNGCKNASTITVNYYQTPVLTVVDNIPGGICSNAQTDITITDVAAGASIKIVGITLSGAITGYSPINSTFPVVPMSGIYW
ncbi:MAG: hypothetical protein WDN75_18455 [Bacteroidota bacterium]